MTLVQYNIMQLENIDKKGREGFWFPVRTWKFPSCYVIEGRLSLNPLT